MLNGQKEYRVEKDFLGEKQIEADVYYGIQTLRASENFPITGYKIHEEMINALAIVKKAAALANMDVKRLYEGIGQAIVQAADEILEGKWHDQFIVDPIQGGAGTSMNMNANEVIGNRALEIMGHKKGDYIHLSPNTHVNMSQSTNDVFPTAIHISTLKLLEKLLKTMEDMHSVFKQKAQEFDSVIKMGRTHLQDAVPIRLGQEFEASLTEVFDPSMIDAVELGLSCDTDMASHVSQLNPYPFLTNSDAHSLGKIGREYNELYVQSADFTEFALALKGQDDRKIIANYGLDPLLGKYYQTACEACGEPAVSGETACANCGKARFTKGVSDRLRELSDQLEVRVPRPRYVHQIPLQFVPGVGPKTLDKLKKAFGTEMAVLHEAAEEDLARVVPPKTAALIVKARSGKLELKAGGGGTYGKIKP